MKKRFIFLAPLFVAAFFAFVFVVMWLWNHLMPGIFGLREISYWEAFGLFLLSKLLFGGFHGGGGRSKWKDCDGPGRREWRRMSAEEKQKYKEEMKGKWREWCGEKKVEKEQGDN